MSPHCNMEILKIDPLYTMYILKSIEFKDDWELCILRTFLLKHHLFWI